MPDERLIREAVRQAQRARRAEREAERLHNWLDDGCTPPAPTRPPWLPRTIHTHFDPPYSQQLEES